MTGMSLIIDFSFLMSLVLFLIAFIELLLPKEFGYNWVIIGFVVRGVNEVINDNWVMFDS